MKDIKRCLNMKNLSDFLLDNDFITKDEGKKYGKLIEGIEQWISEEYSSQLQNWLIDGFAPEIENWVLKEFAPEFEKWVKTNFRKKWFVKKEKDNK